MKKVLTIIVLVAALQLAVVSATYAAPPAWGGGGGAYHHVMYGDTLTNIGRMYNAAPHCIAEANGLWDPNLIFAGTVLYIPAHCPPFHKYGHGGHGGYKPVHYPGYGHGGWSKCTVNCWGGGWGDKCGSPCGGGYHPPKPTPYSGYDYTGYYYGRGHQKYGYSCGYYNNCW
jgi:hypothetical protein